MFSNALKAVFATSALFSTTKKVAHATDSKSLFHEDEKNMISSGKTKGMKKRSNSNNLFSNRRKISLNKAKSKKTSKIKKYNNDWCQVDACSLNKIYIFVQPFANSLENEELKFQRKLEDYLVDFLFNYHDCHENVDKVTKIITCDETGSSSLGKKLHGFLYSIKEGVILVDNVPQLNDFVPSHVQPVKVDINNQDSQFHRAENVFRTYINRTMTADVNNNNMKHEVNILVVGPIMHRYLVANLLQMPSNSWNRITPPQPGSVSIVQLTRTTVKAVQICDTSYQDFPLIEQHPENPKKLGERGYRGDYEDPEGIDTEPEQDSVYHPQPDEDVLDPGFSDPERNPHIASKNR